MDRGSGGVAGEGDDPGVAAAAGAGPDIVCLLGCRWEGNYFVDQCLPMGCTISCSYFEMFSSFLEWVIKDLSGLGSILHFTDGFLVLGPPGIGPISYCWPRYNIFLGFRWRRVKTEGKTEGPTME